MYEKGTRCVFPRREGEKRAVEEEIFVRREEEFPNCKDLDVAKTVIGKEKEGKRSHTASICGSRRKKQISETIQIRRKKTLRPSGLLAGQRHLRT